MALQSLNNAAAKNKEDNDNVAVTQNPRLRSIQDKYRNYFRITCDDLGVASTHQTEQLRTWVFSVRPDEEERIKDLEQTWDLCYSKYLESAYALNREFTTKLNGAIAEKIISRNAVERWESRFRNRNVGYKEREKWVKEEMPRFIEGWRTVAKERNAFIADPKNQKLKSDPMFSILWEDEAFLDLHHEKKKSLIASAKAWLSSNERGTEPLYKDAERKLQGAAARKYLAEGKIGSWLSRIFRAGASKEKIDAFVNGTGRESLAALIENWRDVKERYDHVRNKIRERGESAAARGFTLKSETEFLSLHYETRLKYVEEAEQRIGEAKNVNEELPIFLKIRHAMDIHDWEEADELIMEARMMQLAGRDRERLNSMDTLVKQFSGRKQTTEGLGNVTDAKRRIDHIVEELASSHSELQPMILRLLKGPNANRSIHQFRWIVYNNKWCRTHGYLNQQTARRGASQENKELTKLRASEGSDIGRNDVLDADTQGQNFIRKREYANHKATLMHANVANTAGSNTLATWLEKERDPKVLYWTTYCAHENGEPKSANWHDDLFVMLSELRSLSRTVNNAGFMYGGPGHPLTSRN